MRSSSSVGLGLSLVFGCLLLALIAELYYLLWWKKRVTNREVQESCNSPAKEFLYLFCWKKPSSLSSTGLTTDTQVHEPQSASWFRPHGQGYDHDINVDNELLRLQGLSGPPRFLFTIKEETKEDMESEDKSKKGSKSEKRVIRCPLRHSSSDAEFNRIWASPPPKFKFLRDAEDKLEKRKLIERFGVDGCVQKSDEYNGLKDDENGCFITLVVSKGNEISPQFPSQVLPLAASPPTFRSQFYMNPGLE
ncbi:hypothetical protein Tco_1091432 [Tanacetum coccineum]|uniref:Uncharacterized protein n=1 Tax=Tanacetum coccineum TaxID=301880 RepID=A0ABQ5I872_9ASTR